MKGSTSNRLRKAGFALGAGLVLALAGATLATIGTASGATSASSAVQPSDATVAAKTFSIAQGQAGGLGVGCPEGRRVVGGGVGQSQSTSPTFGYIQQSGPLSANNRSGDVARTWFAAVFNNSGAGVRTYWVFALCSATSNATVQVNPFTVEPRTVNGASVDCPAGKRAVGGGLSQLDAVSPPFGWVQSSGPVDATGTTAKTDTGDVAEGWYASVFNFGATERNFHVYAICADDAESDATIQTKTLRNGEILELVKVDNSFLFHDKIIPMTPVYRMIWVENRGTQKQNILDMRDFSKLEAATSRFDRTT